MFLAPVVTRELLELHTKLHGMPPVAAGTRREYYLPGRWVPHCTIAEGLEPDDICATVELARSSGACREVSIQEVGLVQLGPYRMIAVYPVSPESPTPPSRVRRRTSRCMAMKNPPHPGLSVRHDCLEPLGLSVTEGAIVLGVSRKQLSDIVNCRSGISPEMAIRLDKAFGGGAEPGTDCKPPMIWRRRCGRRVPSKSNAACPLRNDFRHPATTPPRLTMAARCAERSSRSRSCNPRFGFHTQRAVRRPSTRWNSRWLLVTSVNASLRACAAICRSLGPITEPWAFEIALDLSIVGGRTLTVLQHAQP